MAEESPSLSRLINQTKRKKPYNKLDAFKFSIADDEEEIEATDKEITPLDVEDDSSVREYALSESPPDKVINALRNICNVSIT
jgi:hypothetical protein